LIIETENTIIDDILLELLNKHGLTSHQTQNLLERLGGIIEMGQRVARGRRTCDVARQHFRKSGQPSIVLPRAQTQVDDGEVKNIYIKIKENIHKTLSPASGDKSVHKIAFPSKYRTFLLLQKVFA
jgi:hypothetical protein